LTTSVRETDVRHDQDQQLSGRVAIVTGGGGGLGAAISRRLAAAGATVAVCDLRLEAARTVASTIPAGLAEAFALDVSDEASAARVFTELAARHGGVDILINNAGIDATLPVEELSLAEWDRIMATNLRGPFVMSQQAFGAMKTHGSGSIVNIVSTASKRAWANASAYHASKWGLLGLSHALHVEGRTQGIKVTAVIAGGMRTPFLLDRFPDLDPMNLQEPENVADAVFFALTQPSGTVVPEITVIPMQETSWP
jgi:NAD(P)-dependent dehydrogenase (short-subunit alcohol dehydrogenase family)